jgi:hypothetical protein
MKLTDFIAVEYYDMPPVRFTTSQTSQAQAQISCRLRLAMRTISSQWLT